MHTLCQWLLAVIVFTVPAVRADSAVDAQYRTQFNEALADREAGLVYRAIDKLRALLEHGPAEQRVRVELAVSYYRALVFDEAERLVQGVLSEAEVSAEVRENLEGFLDLIRQRSARAAAGRQQFARDLSFSLIHDDNANQSPEDFLGNRAVIRQQEDAAATVAARLTHRYTRPGSIRVRDRAAIAALENQATYYRKEYFDETQFNVDVLSLRSAAELRVGKLVEFTLPLQVDYIRLSDDPLAWFASLKPAIMLPSRFGEWRVTAIAQQREYVASDSEGREGMRTGAEIGWRGRTNDGRFELELALKQLLQRAEQARQQYDAMQAGVQGRWRIDAQWLVRARYQYLRRDYGGSDPLLGGDHRETRQHGLQLGTEYRLADAGWLSDWRLSATVDYTDVQANGSVYEYRRLQYTLGASRRFR